MYKIFLLMVMNTKKSKKKKESLNQVWNYIWHMKRKTYGIKVGLVKEDYKIVDTYCICINSVRWMTKIVSQSSQSILTEIHHKKIDLSGVRNKDSKETWLDMWHWKFRECFVAFPTHTCTSYNNWYLYSLNHWWLTTYYICGL